MYEAPTAPLPDGPFVPTWESLEKIGVPQWYQDAKFGIFIHWGLYCVPAFGNEWYPRNMYMKGTKEFEHHVATYGPQSKFGHKDFIPQFRAEKFDADAWAELFQRAGAKYVIPVAEHHDGFAMYDTALNRWNAAKMGPKRDVVGLLAQSVRERGMVFGVSNHRAEHWWFMHGGREFDSDVQDEAYADFYGPAQSLGETPSTAFKNDWLARLCELVDKYQPQLFYFDTYAERPPLKPYLRHFAAYYFNRAINWGKAVAINYKNDMFAPRTGIMDIERGQLGGINPEFWQTDTSVGNKSWGFITDEEYKSADAIIGTLADVVSKNGTLLLNIGPKADGTIGPVETDILLKIGKWLAVNGEAIYGTRPWKVFGEGPTDVPDGHFVEANQAAFTGQDFRYTTRGRYVIYAICIGRAGNEALLRSLGSNMKILTGEIADVKVLGSEKPVAWSRDADGLRVRANDAGQFGMVLKISLKEPAAGPPPSQVLQ
jgi:alpha-L-fucosidase